MDLVQAMATTKQLQELLWPSGLLDELVHLLALWEGGKYLFFLKVL